MSKNLPDTDELIMLQHAVEATRETVNNTLNALSERIERLIPDIPTRQPISDWRKEVMSWRSWKKFSRKS